MRRSLWVPLLIAASVGGCGVRGNPRPPLPDVRPPVGTDAGVDAGTLRVDAGH
jgi:hypothetical protein